MPGAGLWPGRAPKPRARREGGEQERHSGGRLVLRAAALGVQTQQTVAKLPIWNLALAMQQARDMALNSVDRSSDLRLCQAGFHEFGDDLFPHVTIIMILFPSVNISAGILSKIYQESVDIGKHNPDNDYIATTTQGNEMTKVQKISEMLLDAIATTRSISEGFDKIMGEGAYEKLASDLYDALRAA